MNNGENTMSEIVKPRQSTNLYSWDTSVDSISVSVSNDNYLTVTIGDIKILMSAVHPTNVLELAKAFGKVQITKVVEKTVQV